MFNQQWLRISKREQLLNTYISDWAWHSAKWSIAIRKLTIWSKTRLCTDHLCIQFVPVVITNCSIGIVVADLNSALTSNTAIHKQHISICTTWRKPTQNFCNVRSNVGFNFFFYNSFTVVFQITLLTAVDTIPIVSTVTCTRKTSICVVTVCINVTVVYWTNFNALIDIFTGESISKIACVTTAVIAPNVVCAGSVYITLMRPSFTLINICMHVKTCVIWKSGSITSHQHILISRVQKGYICVNIYLHQVKTEP